MALATLWPAVLVLALLTVTPGLDTALLLRTAVTSGAGRAWAVTLGTQVGTLTWGVLAAAGVAAVLAASPLAFEVLRWLGAAYLVTLGVRIVLATRRTDDDLPDPPRDTVLTAARRGLLTNLLNPKMAAFYAALLSQVVPPGQSALRAGLVLALVHVAMGVTWSALLVAVASRARRQLSRPVVRRWTERISGTVVGAFGVALLLERP
ncbi:MAG: LysE family translocator [Kineosporiaceae bacterium]